MPIPQAINKMAALTDIIQRFLPIREKIVSLHRGGDCPAPANSGYR
jgi:hypothetical protein